MDVQLALIVHLLQSMLILWHHTMTVEDLKHVWHASIITSDKGGGKCFCPCSFVCLSVCQQDYSKTRAWSWMKGSVSTDVGTWTIIMTIIKPQSNGPIIQQ